jgi:hypothetical protein
MTNTYLTGNPLGSTSPKDLYDNASNFDDAMNSVAPAFIDRFGKRRETWAGFEAAFAAFLLQSGYEFIGDYDADGPLTITRPNQIFSKDGDYWRAGPALSLPYTTVNNWVTDQPKFVSVGDAALRAALGSSDPLMGSALVYGVGRVVDTIAALKALPATGSHHVFVAGYYLAGDGGGGSYRYDGTDVASPDNGGSVIVATDGGRWKLTQYNDWSVLQFGAKVDGVTNDTVAIQSAIDALPLNGGTVRIPGGKAKVTTLKLGNGDAATTPSTRNGIKLIGQGAGFAISGAQVPTILSWAGASSPAAIISVAGRISDCRVSGFFLECNALCSGMALNSFSGCDFEDLKIVNPKETGMSVLGGGAPTGNYNVFNKFGQINIALFQPNSVGLYMDGNYAQQNDTWITDFELVRIEVVAGATNAVCAWFKFVDSVSFRRCHFDAGPEPTAVSCIFDAMNNHAFPVGMAFYDCSINRTVVYEDSTHKIRKNYFYGFGTYDLETIPTHNLLCGITDTGEVFGDFLYNEAWLSYVPTITASSGTITTAAGAMRYRRIGKQVFFTCDLFITTNGSGATAVRVTLPPIPGNVSAKNFYCTGRNVTAGGALNVVLAANSQTAFVRKYDDTYPGANSTTLEFSGMYEIA